MAESIHKIHFLDSRGAQVDVPLYTTKEEALANDEGGGSALAVFELTPNFRTV